MSAIAVLNAAQLLTLSGPAPRRGRELGQLGVLDDGALLAIDGTISRVGKSADIGKQCDRQTEVIDASGCVLLPGFVDAHTHLVFAGNRLNDFESRARGDTYEQIARRGGGIQTTVKATRAATEEELFSTAKRHASWMLRNATTTVEAKSGYGLTVADELKLLRVIRRIGRETPLQTVPTFLGAHAYPPEFNDNHAAYLSLLVDEMLPAVAKENLAEYCDVFCENGYFDTEASRRVLQSAKQRELKLRVHADQLSDGGGVQLAAELNAATADHLEQTKDDGIALLAAANVQPVLLPGSVYALGKNKYPAARAMIEAGLPVVLATDFNPGSSPTASIPMVMSLAVTQMRMSPAEAVSAATINAAVSIGRDSQIGSLDPGKLANFAIYDCRDYREIAYWFGLSLVRHVFVRGKQVL